MFPRIVRCANITQGRRLKSKSLLDINDNLFSIRNTIKSVPQIFHDMRNLKPYEDVPGPKPLPLLGNTLRFIPGIGQLSEFADVRVYRILNKQYGNIFKIAGIPGRADIVVLFDPDDIEKVFRNEGPWPFREFGKSIEHYRFTRIRRYKLPLQKYLGEEWHNFRTKVNQIMMQPRTTELYVGTIDAVVSDFIHRIKVLRGDKEEMPADFKNEIQKWALESIVYIALDTRLGCLKSDLDSNSEPQKLINAVHVQFDSLSKMETGLPIWKLFSIPTWRAYVKSADYFVQVSLKYVNEAMKRIESLPDNPNRELTILEKILRRDPDPKTGVVMALEMMVAGVDTTSYSAISALFHLAKNPVKQQTSFEEIKNYLPNKEQPITSEVGLLNELKYLKACIKESMRIIPTVFGNHRKLVKDMELGGYQIPKGTDILIPSQYLSNEERYLQYADKFIPERWIKDGPYSNTKVHPFVMLSFGFGPRMCIGRRFAELEIHTLVAKVIRNFKISYNYGDIKIKPKMLNTPVSPLKFKMENREL
ncbi:hypothetical protein L9F63_012070 [Diploptera punctata]|uniref:Cytochrome P450 n=1 Tax=Diploptera punctata TaxID=6984 RepID=A0AAD8EN48_DIPPU|nr:hypothetical protein L9F63_012070 [Diploptera punctata]